MLIRCGECAVKNPLGCNRAIAWLELLVSRDEAYVLRYDPRDISGRGIGRAKLSNDGAEALTDRGHGKRAVCTRRKAFPFEEWSHVNAGLEHSHAHVLDRALHLLGDKFGRSLAKGVPFDRLARLAREQEPTIDATLRNRHTATLAELRDRHRAGG